MLYEALGIKPGITAFVGAGGKTTAIEEIAQELYQQKKRVVVTTTTHIFPPKGAWCSAVLISPTKQQIQDAASMGICTVAGGINESGKLTNIGEFGLSMLEQCFDYILVEADGSRHMPCKVPASHEPVIPKDATTVVGVMGMTALEKPLQQVCFRAQLAAELLGISVCDRVTPPLLAHLACSSLALQKDCNGHRFSLLLNQMEQNMTGTKEVARRCNGSNIDHRVCASLHEKTWETF